MKQHRNHPYHSALGNTPIPKIIAGDYQRCQDAFAQKVIYKLLLNLGYEQQDASEMADSVKGSVIERKEALGI